MTDEQLIMILEGMQAELAAHKIMLGLVIAEAPEALDAIRRAAAVADEVTLPTALTDPQREAVKALLQQTLEQADRYRALAHPPNK